LPGNDRQRENLVAVVSELSERVTLLVREEIELAKAEVTQKALSLAKGAAAIAVGAVFGLFALIFGLLTVAWGINQATGKLWIGFIAVFGLLLILGILAVLFAVRKLKVGAPAPTMAIDEAKRIRETVTAKTGDTPALSPGATRDTAGATVPAASGEDRR
jgi:uncharacterized small protein (DUF1192 family)